MANVILIGATGFVGSAVLNELVERGHHVTAVVRNAAKLPKSSQVEAVEADVADVEKVADLACGKPRLIIVGGAGTLFVKPGLRVVDSGAIPAEIMDGVRPLGDFYLNTLTRETNIDWVFFSPAGEFDAEGSKTGKYRLGKDDLLVDATGKSHISVRDYAAALVDELEHPAHHRTRFTIGY